MSSKSKKGFTIIEVVLVLAIAGLIFLMVFIALPALQRSQRNTQRGDDLSRVLTAVNSYQSNNSGQTPFEKSSMSVNANFVKRYIDETCTQQTDGISYSCSDSSDQFKDPDGETYKMKYEADVTADGTANFTAVDHTFHVYTNASCSTEGEYKVGTGSRQVAIFYVNEGGSIQCNDNH